MSGQVILTASAIITMNDANPRAKAIAVDTGTGRITAVGSLEECTTAAPGATVTDLGSTVLMPGFVEPHGHPLLAGMLTQPPVYWIAPYVGYSRFDDVKTLFAKVDKETPAGQPVVFNGLDRLLQQVKEPTNTDLDVFFPDRPAVVVDNSGHAAYFNSRVIESLGWSGGTPPADPTGGRYGRNADGTSNGIAYESSAVIGALLPTLLAVVTNPLASAAKWFAAMARFGITASSELTFASHMLKGYEALLSQPDSPLRLSLYTMSTEADCGDTVTSAVPESMMRKQGIKLWADGSPWVGSIASSNAYLDNPTVRTAGIPLGPGGTAMMNYTRDQLDAILAKYAPMGWQMAFHVNGDIGLDNVLDAYEQALHANKLMGTDHRWRIEHCGGCRGDQFKRAADLGVVISLGPFQFIYWGDLLDGTMFPSEVGSQWMAWGDAVRTGATVCFHNDGPVSPPNMLLNIQTAITRATPSGTVHGPNQIISLDDALKAQTLNAARALFRDTEIGSLEVGKYADLVELSTDPYTADPRSLAAQVKVQGTWLGGRRLDTDAYIAQVTALGEATHQDVDHASLVGGHKC